MPSLDSFWVVILLIFGAVFLLAQLAIPMLDGSARSRRQIQERVRILAVDHQASQPASMLRDRFLMQLKPWERQLESLPTIERLRAWQEQAGLRRPGYRTILLSIAASAGGTLAGYLFFRHWAFALPVGLIAAALPFVRIRHLRQKRIARFDEQLPDAVDVMVRAMRAGFPFSEALRLVSTEMDAPARDEFALIFNDINFGGDVRGALMRQIVRVPSVTMMALATAVLVQRETGGNLAEVLEKIAAVLRGRFRFQRRVRTLSAEGRITAWVLTMTPIFLFVAISVVNPGYMPMLTGSPYGPKLIAGAFVLMVLGVMWMRRILRIEV